MTVNPVRTTTESFTDNTDYVSINADALDQLVSEYEDQDFDVPYWNADDPAPVFPDDDWSDEDRMQFFYVGNAINAHFTGVEVDEDGDASVTGRFAVDYAGNPWGVPFDGAFGMWRALKRGVEEGHDLLDAEYLASVSEEDLEHIFRPADDAIEMPLLYPREVPDDLREKGVLSKKELIHEAGDLLQEYGGSFDDIVEYAGGQAFGDDGIVTILADSPAYQDAWAANGQTVRFDKRAQLLVNMVHGAFQGREDTFNITDMDEFTVFADYRLPQYLEEKGVLDYAPELVERIEDQKEIPAGSQEELEIRAQTVQAGDAFDMPIPELDYALWNGAKNEEMDKPHHLTRTSAY